MDEITEKRVENDIKRINDGMRKISTAAGPAIGQMLDVPALQAEIDRLIPKWAGDLTAMPGAMCTYVNSRLRALGAPKEYTGQLLRAVIDETAPRLWPQPGAERPAWVVDPHQCECGQEHPGGAFDQASQLCRLLGLAYAEFVEVVAAGLILGGEISAAPATENAERQDRDVALVRERALAVMELMFSIFNAIEM